MKQIPITILIFIIVTFSCLSKNDDFNSDCEFTVLDTSGQYESILSENMMDSTNQRKVKNNQLLILEINQEQVKINNKDISLDSIKTEVSNFLSKKINIHNSLDSLKEPGFYAIIIALEDEIPFGQYYEIRKEVLIAFSEIRNKISKKIFDKNYNRINQEKRFIELKVIEQFCPINIFEFNPTRHSQ